jgi:hypothetical protein
MSSAGSDEVLDGVDVAAGADGGAVEGGAGEVESVLQWPSLEQAVNKTGAWDADASAMELRCKL